MRLTRIGGPTVLVESDGWRILLDPTFDPPGRTYDFGWGTSSRKTQGPFVEADAVGPIDIALVSHDHHADNLDDRGRLLLTEAAHVVTTASGARRLGLPQAIGLVPGESTTIEGSGKSTLTITATPCRHGPPLTHPIVGDVIGFAVARAGESTAALWFTGDTVLYPAVLETAAALDVDVAVVNAGGVRFGITGPLRFTMNGVEAVKLIEALDPRVVAPAHFDGWTHFRDGESGLRAAISVAPPSVQQKMRWLPDGVPTEV